MTRILLAIAVIHTTFFEQISDRAKPFLIFTVNVVWYLMKCTLTGGWETNKIRAYISVESGGGTGQFNPAKLGTLHGAIHVQAVSFVSPYSKAGFKSGQIVSEV